MGRQGTRTGGTYGSPAGGAHDPETAAEHDPETPAAGAHDPETAAEHGPPGEGRRADADTDLLFGALADPTRRRVVQLLGTRPWRAGELATAAGTSGPAMSRHLRVLLRAGLVADERLSQDARARVFRLRPQSLTALRAWLDQLQAHWDEQLASFKRHVDGRR